MTENSVMTHRNVGVLAIEAVEAPEVVTSAWIDEQLADGISDAGSYASVGRAVVQPEPCAHALVYGFADVGAYHDIVVADVCGSDGRAFVCRAHGCAHVGPDYERYHLLPHVGPDVYGS